MTKTSQYTTHNRLAQLSRCFSIVLLGFVLVACHSNTTTATRDTPASVHTTQATRILTPDWGIAAELTALGYPPIATGDLRMYEQWMGKPLPKQTIDLGIRYQPNPELIAQLNVDLVIDNFFYEHIRPMYGSVPTKSVLFKAKGDVATWQDFATATIALGQILQDAGNPQGNERVQTYLTQSQQVLQQQGQQFRHRYPNIKKLAIVQFADAGHLRLYADNSLFKVTTDQLGVSLVNFHQGNKWGFNNIELAELAKLENDSCLIVIKPFSHMLQAELDKSVLWQQLGFGHKRCMAIIDPVWSYGGGIASMRQFADQLSQTPLQGVAPPNLSSPPLSNTTKPKG